MKKLFAILAAVCMFAAMNVFADTWESTSEGDAPHVGQFTAGVVCTPSWGMEVAIPELGNFFAGHSDVSVGTGHTILATLTGPPASEYTFHLTPGASESTTAYGPVAGSALYSSTASGLFDGKIYDDDASGAYIEGTWTRALVGQAFGCTDGIVFTYTVNTITTVAGNAGTTLSFTITAEVSVSI